MELFNRASLTVGFVLLFIGSLSAQDKPVTASLFFFGDNTVTAVALPVPQYPGGARKINLGGRVSVAVRIDQNGNVIMADDASGPFPVCKSVTEPNVLELRRVAIEAARSAKFRPGDTAETIGRIIYDFPAASPDPKSSLGEMQPMHYSASNSGDESGTSKSIVNGKATVLPKPPYPPAAKAVRASGSVGIQVLIDIQGNVFSAEAVNGHPLLRLAAVGAACGAKFSPTFLEGKPVEVSGIITYNFVP